MNEADLEPVAATACGATNHATSPGKPAMIRARLARRLRPPDRTGFAACCPHLDAKGGAAEIGGLVSSPTANASRIFREAHHVEPQHTDCHAPPVRHARARHSSETMVPGRPANRRARLFHVAPNPRGPGWRANDDPCPAVRVRTPKLLAPWPMRGRFEAIYCRDGMLCFHKDTKAHLGRRFLELPAPRGGLSSGHSERLSESTQNRCGMPVIIPCQRPDRLPETSAARAISFEGP